MSDGNGGSKISDVDISDIVITAVSLIFYVVDIIFDILLLAKYEASGDTRWFAFTLIVLLMSSLSINAFNFWLHYHESKGIGDVVLMFVFAVLQISPLLR